MEAIVSYILKQSKLEVTLIKIANPSTDAFNMEIISRVLNTGPISATMQPMTVDLVFKGVAFGKLKLPEIKTSPKEVEIHIPTQEIKILDMTAFKAFVRALMLDEDLVLSLDNGQSIIKALGMTSHVQYHKDIHIKGMNGPPCKIVQTDRETNIIAIHNQSPLEIDHGVSMFNILDASKTPVAHLKGVMRIKRGYFEVTMNIARASAPSGQAGRLVGKGTEKRAWTNETLAFIDTPLHLTEQFISMY